MSVEPPADEAATTRSFYGWLWRRLPGPWPTRVGLLALVAAAVIVLLFAVVFPWLEPRLPFNQVTVGDGAAVPRDHGSGGGWAA